MFIFSVTSLPRLLGREVIPSTYHPPGQLFLRLRGCVTTSSADLKTYQTLVIRMAGLREALAFWPPLFGDPAVAQGRWDGAAQRLAAPSTGSLPGLTRKGLGSPPEFRLLWVLPFWVLVGSCGWQVGWLLSTDTRSPKLLGKNSKYLKITACLWRATH